MHRPSPAHGAALARRVPLLLAALTVVLSSGCRGVQIRQLEHRIDQLESRVANLEGRLAAPR